ncbi:SGNH/GDSL hydrolase family protein [Elusimicrobiota bacterium]
MKKMLKEYMSVFKKIIWALPGMAAAIAGLTAAVILFEVFAYFLYAEKADPSVRLISGFTQTIYFKMEYFYSQCKVVDRLGYELVANSTPYLNSFGTFDKEYQMQKPANTYRVLVLGDSVTYGYGIYPGKDRYTEILERKLNKRKNPSDIKFEVINAGFSGYDLMEYEAYIDMKAKQFDPDMIIIGISHTDTDIRRYAPLYIYNKEAILYKSHYKNDKFFAEYLCRYSLLCRLFAVLRTWFGDQVRKKKDDEKIDNSIKNIKNFSEENNIALLAVVFPKAKKLTEHLEKEIAHYQYILNRLKKNNIDFFDLTGGLIGEADNVIIEDLKIDPDNENHFSEKGHSIIGALLFDYLSNNHKPMRPADSSVQ